MNTKNLILGFCIILCCSVGWGFLCHYYIDIAMFIGSFCFGSLLSKIIFKFFPLYGTTK